MMARRYNCRPSALLELSGWRALAVDVACFEAGVALEIENAPQQPGHGRHPPLKHQVG